MPFEKQSRRERFVAETQSLFREGKQATIIGRGDVTSHLDSSRYRLERFCKLAGPDTQTLSDSLPGF